MIAIKSRKWATTFAVVAATLAVSMGLLVYPTFAEEPLAQSKCVLVNAKGWAFQRIDNETIKQYPVNLTLTLELGEKNDSMIPVLQVNGSVNIKGVIYTIEEGTGAINTQRHVAWVRCTGIDAEVNRIIFNMALRYFWWGGNLYAFRSIAVLKTGDRSMLLRMRGVAKIY